MFNDVKARAIAVQGVLLLVLIGFATLLFTTTVTNLEARGIPIGFDFLTMPSRLVISESMLSYGPRDPYYWAIVVGIANTILISALVIGFSSIIGLILGITRLSSNPLASGTCKVWIEVARNTPPIVLLIFLYSLWWKVLPPITEAFNLAPGTYVSMRGMVMPSVNISLQSIGWGLLGLAILFLGARAFRTFFPQIHSRSILTLVGAVAIGIWVANVPANVDWPVFTGFSFRGGITLTPELSTILVGLTIYTSGFVAEIVRGGVLAIGKGQWDAGRSLGLSRTSILRLIVIPQTLRIIVPPLNSQYINVVKNSTLAIAVGYPDFLAVMNTTISKSSHSIEGLFIILGVYLALNLTLSAAANWYNRRIAIVER
ncbi:amino acid ABC transporter permease [Rhizobium sullae]|uniref:amino acid ABC transporter permease n=1 Tax=Rhizobium sullae TaxID=50338 RepID=UPI000B35A122|nr:ABC transporter permease subunit [Rhizobium sullae]